MKQKLKDLLKKKNKPTFDEAAAYFTAMTDAQKAAKKGSGGPTYNGGWLPQVTITATRPSGTGSSFVYNRNGLFGSNRSPYSTESIVAQSAFQVQRPSLFQPSPYSTESIVRQNMQNQLKPYTPPQSFLPTKPNTPSPVFPTYVPPRQPIIAPTHKPELVQSTYTPSSVQTGPIKNTFEKTGNTDPADSLYGTKDMRTIGFIAKHPIIAAQIGSFEKGSTNISTNVVRFANTLEVLSENKTSDQENMGSQVNAFRHSLWQATITQKFGEEVAREVGAAHEDNPSANLSQRIFKTMADADQTIDLLNNQIGRQIGKENPSSSMQGLAIKTLDHFAEKGLYVATMEENGTFNVSQEKVKSEQYRSLLNRFKQLNDNGFTLEVQQERDLAAQRKIDLLNTGPKIK